jgi:hypothetical protein
LGIIIEKKRFFLMDVTIPSDMNIIQKEAEQKLKVYKSKFINSANVEYETLRHNNNLWGHRYWNEMTIRISGNNTRKALVGFSTKSSCTRDIAHNKVKCYSLKLEA